MIPSKIPATDTSSSNFHPIFELRRENPNINVMVEGVATITSEQDRQISSSAVEGKCAFQAAQWTRPKRVPTRSSITMNLEAKRVSPLPGPSAGNPCVDQYEGTELDAAKSRSE